MRRASGETLIVRWFLSSPIPRNRRFREAGRDRLRNGRFYDRIAVPRRVPATRDRGRWCGADRGPMVTGRPARSFGGTDDAHRHGPVLRGYRTPRVFRIPGQPTPPRAIVKGVGGAIGGGGSGARPTPLPPPTCRTLRHAVGRRGYLGAVACPRCVSRPASGTPCGWHGACVYVQNGRSPADGVARVVSEREELARWRRRPPARGCNCSTRTRR